MTRKERVSAFYDRFYGLGFKYEEIESMRRIEMTLHRWCERECNGEIERDETTDKTYSVSMAYINGSGDYKRYPTADKETGALIRLAKLMQSHKEYETHYQSDPRGCALYIVRKTDIREGEKIDAVYTRGFPVCY